MILLAIDPGPVLSAFVTYAPATRKLHLGDKVPNGDLVMMVRQWTPLAHHLAIEMIQHYGTGMPAGAEVFDTCVWIGRFIEGWGGREYTLIKRPAIKAHLCGSARAKDANVRQALIDRYGGKATAIGTKAQPGPLHGVSGDVWAALALAITWAETEGVKRHD